MNPHHITDSNDRALRMNSTTLPIIRDAIFRTDPALADAISETIRTGTCFHEMGNLLNRDDRRSLLTIHANLQPITIRC